MQCSWNSYLSNTYINLVFSILSRRICREISTNQSSLWTQNVSFVTKRGECSTFRERSHCRRQEWKELVTSFHCGCAKSTGGECACAVEWANAVVPRAAAACAAVATYSPVSTVLSSQCSTVQTASLTHLLTHCAIPCATRIRDSPSSSFIFRTEIAPTGEFSFLSLVFEYAKNNINKFNNSKIHARLFY